MRIGINAFPLRRGGGGARYTFAGLLSALLRLDREHRYIIFAHLEGLHLIYQVLKEQGETLGGTGPDPRVRVIHIADEGQIYAHRYEFDLYFGPLNNLNPRLYDRPTVAILHDIQEQYLPENFSKTELLGRREVYPDICRSATTLVAISDFCKQSFVEKFGTDPSKIEVVYNAPQAQLVDRDRADDGHWSRDPLPKDFLFYPANWYRHKNHRLLLDAIERMRAAGKCPSVVFSGFELPGGFPLRKEIAKRGLKDVCHIFTDLPAEELRYLYRHALAAVLPTTFEGFCMPVVEAAACGCPIVCSDLSVLHEIVGDNVLYFDPTSVDDLVGQIQRITEDADLRRRLIEGGYAAAARFNWDDSARQMLRIFREAPERFAWGRHKPGSVRRPRIGVLLRLNQQGRHVVPTVESLLLNGYPDLVILCPASKDVPRPVVKFLESAGVKLTGPGAQIETKVKAGSARVGEEVDESEDAADDELDVDRGELDDSESEPDESEVSVPDENGSASKKEKQPAPPPSYADLRAFAQEYDLDLVTEVIEGHRFKVSGIESAAWAFLEDPQKAVYLGEAMEWKGENFVGIARMRLTGDQLWKMEGFLYPEILFINAPVLEGWTQGLERALEGSDEWRWELLREARFAGRLHLSQRTLADCNRNSIGYRAGRMAIRSGMFDYYDDVNGKSTRVRLLRRIEPVIKRAAGALPMSVQHAGTRVWYHLAR